MSGISGVSGAGSSPQQPIEITENSPNQEEAMNLFHEIAEKLTYLANEAKLGGKGHG